jgi:putative OPT family oligopeptide transporter
MGAGQLNERAGGAESLAEFTLRAVSMGVVLGVVFGAANAYTGARFGMTVCASIPAAVMTVAFFRALRMRCTILEANISQTIGSASTSMATGAVFTIPALFMWGIVPPFWQVAILCLLGGLLGIAAMVPLRRLLIVEQRAELPYPEGTACAEVLRTTVSGVSGGAWIFGGMLVGAAVKVAVSILFLIPLELGAYLPVLPKAYAALEVAPIALGVGYILGFRQSAVIVSGSLIASFVLIPLIATVGEGVPHPVFPETTKLIRDMSDGDLWGRYIRYIGAGAVAFAGLMSIIMNFPMMIRSFGSVASGLRKAAGGAGAPVADRTQRDIPAPAIVGIIALVVLVAWLVPGVFPTSLSSVQRFVCSLAVAILGVFFVTVASRIVGLVGVTSQPTSAIALLSIISIALVFVLAGWASPETRTAILVVGTIVSIAASKAGDISQDLKTGFLVGATPSRQQVGQMIGAAVACWFVAATVLLLGATLGYGGDQPGALKVPQATLMRTVIDAVVTGQLPWVFILTGAGMGAGAMLCGASGLAFGIGLYLPLAAMAPIFVGGVVRALVERRRSSQPVSLSEAESNPGVLAASGLVAGEGLAGVLVAGLVAGKVIEKSGKVVLDGTAGNLAGLAVVLATCLFLYVAGRRRGR